MASASAIPIPITIVTGFLGSGKTTLILNLVRQLLSSNPGYRLALLKNEFGDVAVDSQLAASSAVSGVRELLNGCICCNLVGQLSEALKELCEGEGEGEGFDAEKRPNRIVVETSGSAFPATLALEVNRISRETGGAYTLDGVVSVIDVENWRGYEDTSYTARIQARYTDLVVFNKWEGCDERRFDECLDRLGDLELDTPTAWVKSDRGWVDKEVVFGIDGGLAGALTDEGGEEGEGNGHEGGHTHEHKHGHQSEVEVLSVELKVKGEGSEGEGGAVNADKLLVFLKSAPKDEVYRIKAVLTANSTVRNSDEDADIPTPPHPRARYILNWAFGRWTFTPMGENVEEHESTRNKGALKMTMILARYESTKWKKKLEAGGLVELDGEEKGELVVTKIN
ncbi:CobW/HypB/UreG, nucleotide-binding domain-containing protein [Diplogelasinospora grovesii]|uniref:CobW/HypB/UreG, nucleotide-binding domain-containing protein n=1 Tax=Diplogelasinospora grovesii TaxID=303347 RepID=A0AAN6MZR4_9PEZI|nr:CobW/HypB/UreG, nucleotide-binding domain-containing protein [Diplogelasinospora grovesii]